MLFSELLLVLAAAIPAGDDQALAESIRNGDRSAFRKFFEAWHKPLLRYLLHRRVPPDVAEDLVQNAFVHIWENRGKIRTDGSLKGLLFRIGYTRALNHFRDTARFEGELDEQALGVPAPDVDPAEQRDVRDRVREAVDALPERRRAVFELCVLEGLSYAEAAEALEISRKTVENHMGYALKAVRERLSGLRP
ncbi:MAG: sigma-70 family RNA polymerase sigma factor, partial [Rhodothermales bacterium]|nr:sigma-70 family RNA polymerase sigma factor [Rhodothermales bacterium]